MNTYSAYKDSGEQWLGQIPAHWEMRQWRFLLKENVTPNTDCKETQQLQFKYGEIIPKANQEIDSDTLKIICKYNKVQPNDIMINGLNLNYDFISQRIGMVRTNGIITSAYISLRPIGSANPSYYNYLLKAMDAQKMFHGMGTGVRLTLSYKELKSKYLPFPTEAEQEAMVAYLDEQTGKLDQAIAREQKMIDLLEERKRIIIQGVVTRGLDFSAPMKESGIDVVGLIPAHWSIGKLKHYTKIVLGKMLQSKDPHSKEYTFEYYLKSKNVGWLKVENTDDIEQMWFNKQEKKLYLLHDNDIIMNEGGTIGKVALWKQGDYDCYIQNSVHKITTGEDLLPEYLLYYLYSISKSGYFEAVVNRVSIGHLTKDKLSNTPIVFPDKEEQQAISTYLDERLASIDRAIKFRNRMITLLQERKQIIINEVVTGKIKVL